MKILKRLFAVILIFIYVPIASILVFLLTIFIGFEKAFNIFYDNGILELLD